MHMHDISVYPLKSPKYIPKVSPIEMVIFLNLLEQGQTIFFHRHQRLALTSSNFTWNSPFCTMQSDAIGIFGVLP